MNFHGPVSTVQRDPGCHCCSATETGFQLTHWVADRHACTAADISFVRVPHKVFTVQHPPPESQRSVSFADQLPYAVGRDLVSYPKILKKGGNVTICI